MAGFTLKKNQLDPLNTALLRTWYHSQCDSYSPTAATVAKFTVAGGDILVHLMYATVDTTLETTASNVSVQANPTTGTTDVIATTVDATGVVAGDHILVEGDGSAAVVAGVLIFPLGAPTPWICPIGDIEVIHAAAMTGTLHWDLFWEPLSENASVTAA